MNTPTLDMIKYLGDLASCLNRIEDADDADDDFFERLKVLCGLMGTRSVALHRKQYLGQAHFILETVCQWPAADLHRQMNNLTLDSNEVTPEWWQSLASGEPVLVCSGPLLQIFAGKTILLVPVCNNRRLYGFLSFTDVPEDVMSKWHMEMAKSVGRIVELWMGKKQKAKQLDDLIEFMPYPVLGMDMDEKVSIWNQSMEQMTGWPAARIIGKGNYEHAIPFYGERRPTSSNLILNPDLDWERRYVRFTRGVKTVTALARGANLPGGGATIASKTGVVYDLNNRPCGSVHVIQDVTHEQEMAENLHRTESMYHTLTDFAGLGIALFEKNGHVLNANDHFCELIGMNCGQAFTFDDILDRIDPGDRHEISNLFQNMFNEPSPPSRFEFAGSNGDGRQQHFRGYAQTGVFEDQAAVHFIIDDITDQKKRAHRKREDELRMYHKERLSALGVMAAGVAHELNQPLNTIRVTTDGFLYGRDQGWDYDEAEIYQGLEMISRQVIRLSGVIQNIRDFTREERSEAVVNIDANQAVEYVFSMFGRQIEAHGIHLDKVLEPELPPMKANKNQMEQVIMNLVVNARQALDETDKKDKRMWIKTGARYGQIFIEVGDSATGIPEEAISRIFDPFFTTKPVGKGTGLGLSISQRMVADFNGQIKAYNNTHGGATFFITAPQSESVL